MKKRFLSAAIVAALCIGIYMSTEDSDGMSSLQLSNVEALTNVEDNDCHYNNGYSAFTSKKGGAYDCCKVWVANAPNTSEGHCR